MTSTISRKLRVLALIMALVMVMPCVAGFGIAANVDDGLLTANDIEEIGRLEEPATRAYLAIMSAWRNADGETIYPEAYGGCYLRDDYMLVIKLVDDDEELRADINSIVGNNDYVTYVSTDVSLNTLYNIAYEVNDMLPGVEISSCAISQTHNKVEVGVFLEDMDVAEECVSAQSQMFSLRNPYDYIVLCPEQELIPMLNPANPLSGEGTLGWYGTGFFNGNYKPCILMAGHVVRALQSSNRDIILNGETVFSKSNYGNLDYSAIYYPIIPDVEDKPLQTTYGDFALLAYNVGSLSPSHYVQKTNNSAIEIHSYLGDTNADLLKLEGKTVYKGLGVSQYKSAKVLTTSVDTSNVPVDANNVKVYNMVSVEGNSFFINGDSGGPIFMQEGGENILCGIVTSKNLTRPTIFYFTPITLVCQWGFSPYLG